LALLKVATFCSIDHKVAMCVTSLRKRKSPQDAGSEFVDVSEVSDKEWDECGHEHQYAEDSCFDEADMLDDVGLEECWNGRG